MPPNSLYYHTAVVNDTTNLGSILNDERNQTNNVRPWTNKTPVLHCRESTRHEHNLTFLTYEQILGAIHQARVMVLSTTTRPWNLTTTRNQMTKQRTAS